MGRFYLHFKDAIDICKVTPQYDITFRYRDDRIMITNPDKESGCMKRVNLAGQVLHMEKLTGQPDQCFLVNQATGIHLFSLQT